jgi:hypothetical protein
MLTTTTSDFGGWWRTRGVVPVQVGDGNRQRGRTLQARDQPRSPSSDELISGEWSSPSQGVSLAERVKQARRDCLAACRVVSTGCVRRDDVSGPLQPTPTQRIDACEEGRIRYRRAC